MRHGDRAPGKPWPKARQDGTYRGTLRGKNQTEPRDA